MEYLRVNPRATLYLQGIRAVENRYNLHRFTGMVCNRLRYHFFPKVPKTRLLFKLIYGLSMRACLKWQLFKLRVYNRF